jgi:hypothetical protein
MPATSVLLLIVLHAIIATVTDWRVCQAVAPYVFAQSVVLQGGCYTLAEQKFWGDQVSHP